MDRRHLLALLTIGLLSAAPAGAQGPGSGAATADANAQQVQQLERKLDAALKYIEGLRSELDALKKGTATAAPAPATTAAQPSAPAPPPPAPQGLGPSQPPDATQQARATAPEAEPGPSPDQERPTFVPTFLRQANAVLIPRDMLEIDPRFQYGYNDTDVLAVAGLDLIETIFIGTIEVERRRRDSFTAAVDGRYGITDRLQLSANVPYRFEIEELTLPPQVQRLPDPFPSQTDHGHGLGDIEFGLSYHALREKNWLPDLIVGASIKTNSGQGPFDTNGDTPTGTGFWGVIPQMTLVKVTDPGILFASASYLYHIEDDVGGIGDVDPGDILQLSAGWGYALNPYLSLTTRLQLSHAWDLSVNGEEISGTDLMAGTMSFGLTYGLTRHTAVDVAVDIGITDDAPDFRVGIGIPFQFRLPPWKNLFRRGHQPPPP